MIVDWYLYHVISDRIVSSSSVLRKKNIMSNTKSSQEILYSVSTDSIFSRLPGIALKVVSPNTRVWRHLAAAGQDSSCSNGGSYVRHTSAGAGSQSLVTSIICDTNVIYLHNSQSFWWRDKMRTLAGFSITLYIFFTPKHADFVSCYCACNNKKTTLFWFPILYGWRRL